MLDQGIDDLGGILGTAGYQIETACGETSFVQSLRDGPVTAWGLFGGFKDGSVTRGEGARGGADAKDIRRIPSLISKQ